MNTMAVILAAGDGTRMKSKTSKVLHEAAGLPMVEWVLRAIEPAQAKDTILVCGRNLKQMEERYGNSYTIVEQKERLGTGHAVMTAEKQLENFDGYTLILAGDMPLLQPQSIEALVQAAENGDYDLMLLTSDMAEADPTGYGRIIRNKNGDLERIVEEKDATEEQKKVTEVNISCYCVKNTVLLDCLGRIRPQNEQDEYYITDIVGLIREDGGKMGAHLTNGWWEGFGVNSRADLYQAESMLRGLIVGKHLDNGVSFIDANSTYIDADTTIGMDTIIHPGVILQAGCTIAEDVLLYPGSRISGSTIGANTVVEDSVIVDSAVGSNCNIGPYAHIRPGTEIKDGCKVGAFAEVKNSELGEGTKVPHLSYVGDSSLGKNVNVGCGTVFVNYDGKNKHASTIEDNAFIGCNTNIISPVHIGEGAYIAAGGTITQDVPKGAFAIARSRQSIKENWKDKREND